MIGIESKYGSRDFRFRVIVVVGIVVISAYVLWFFVLPIIGRYERLNVHSYYWVTNNHGEIRQLVVQFGNNGTLDFVLKEIWLEGVMMDNDSWGSNGWRIYVAPQNFSFETGRDYSFTVITSRRQYSFVLDVNENNTKTEKVKISYLGFINWPPIDGEPAIQIVVQGLSGTDMIIKKALINGEPRDLLKQMWLTSSDNKDGTAVYYPWVEGNVYYITIETVAGSTATNMTIAD